MSIKGKQEKNTVVLEEIKRILGTEAYVKKDADCIDLWTI